MRVVEEVSRAEFIRRAASATRSAAEGRLKVYIGTEAMAGNSTRMVLRAGDATCSTMLRQTNGRGLMPGAAVIDEFTACELIAKWADMLVNDAQLRRAATTQRERRAIKLHRKVAPCSFAWCSFPGGRHAIWAYNVDYAPIWPHGEWRELAGHPSDYGTIWRVVEKPPEDGFGGGQLYFDCLPSLARWAEFETVNAHLWAREYRRCVEPVAESSASQA